ncbi:MAG: Wadjet anti-phage system protein JetD domain-containing protein [Acidobacteriaceae bacterium]
MHLPLRAEQTGRARSMLGGYISAFPVLESVVAAWERGKKVRGHDPSGPTLHAIADAVTVMLSRQSAADEVLLRRESTRLFNDSKRLEKLGKWLDVLMNDDVASSGLMDAEVFSALGLLKEPQPFLISAAATAHGDEISSPLFRPYQGLPMEAIRGFTFEVAPRCVLSVENKQTFHEIATLATGSAVCAIYSGGMPSPAWHRVYASLLSAIPSSTVVYHFGDLDVGGFRIAHAIAQTAKVAGHTLQPWMMDPIEIQSIGRSLYPATELQLAEMKLWCQRIGWTSIGSNIATAPGLLEQEAVPPALPS